MVEPLPGKLRIALCSDFFYPNIGGVEMHIYQLGHFLIEHGNKVIVITHQYGDRRGVRYFRNGMKVYYMPYPSFAQNSTFPTFSIALPYFRNIFIREQIDVIHSHQTASCLGHEAIRFGRTMGIPCVFTDHSLFGFKEVHVIITNRFLECNLCNLNTIICVSNTCKENTVLRLNLNPDNVYVIPNALDSDQFTPNPAMRDPNKITIVILSRLVYRKGLDLVVDVIPKICAKFPQVHWVIGGDGDKRLNLEEMREKYLLQDRVELLGAIPHAQARDVIVRGDIFLNSSLTEAFCIAILEAVCCGLLVVSTKVGGVPEVLPPDMILYSQPTREGIEEKLIEAIRQVEAGKVDPWVFHERAKTMYNWSDVAERTEEVYRKAIEFKKPPMLHRYRKIFHKGFFCGLVFCFLGIMIHLICRICEWVRPANTIDLSYEMKQKDRMKLKKRFDVVDKE